MNKQEKRFKQTKYLYKALFFCMEMKNTKKY